MLEIGIISRWSLSLPQEVKDALLLMDEKGKEEKDPKKIPIYYRDKDKGEVFFIQDCFAKSNKAIQETKIKGVLYPGGGVLPVKVKEGWIVIPDERSSHFKFFAGIAKYEEGLDLLRTAKREGMEEVRIVSIDETVLYLPPGIEDDLMPKTNEIGSDFSVERFEITGKTSSSYFFNDNERHSALEVKLRWDISNISIRDIKVFHKEKWFSGGLGRFVPSVLNNKGEEIGHFSGRQGFIEKDKFGLHPAVRCELGLDFEK
jgi:hypothetical protein